MDKEKRTALMIDVAVPGENRVRERTEKKKVSIKKISI